MSKRIDIMLDLESLSLDHNTSLLQVSALEFDINTGTIRDKFDEYIDITKNEELVYSSSTLSFWLNGNKEAFNEIIKLGNKSEETVIKEFHDWVSCYINEYGSKNVFVWANGLLFDLNVIETKFKKYGLEDTIYYGNKLDFRSILKTVAYFTNKDYNDIYVLAEEYLKEKGLAHNALYDNYSQISALIYCVNKIKELNIGK